jgi:biopolymer transport protein ExbB/TolQ
MDVLGILAGMLLTGLVGLVATGWWMLRLWNHRNKLPLGTKIVAATVAVSASLAAIGVVIGLVKVFGAIGGESIDPSQRARVLAEGISEAMNISGLGILVWLPSAMLLLALSRTRKSQSP